MEIPTITKEFLKMRFKNLVCCVFAACGLIAADSVQADDSWPTFRGEQRTGVSEESGLMTKWPESGPKLLWSAKGAGRGYASLAIVDGKIYTLGDGISTKNDQDEYVTCFDQATGKQIWASKTGSPWNDGKPTWQGSRSTPTVDGDRVYVLTPHGDLICLRSTGEEVWRRNVKSDFDGKKADSWGYSESVTIDGNKLICTPGGEKNTMVALDKQTGETLWTASHPGDRGAGHASVVIATVGDERVYVQTTGSGAIGVRASDGKLLWSYDIKQTTAVIPTPIVRGDLVFVCAGYGTGGALIKQVASGGNVTIEEIYPTNSELGNKHGGIVLVGDHLYADTEDRGTPYCAEMTTGEVKWKSRGSGKNSASVTAADGHLYIRYSDGTMVLAKASPEKYEEQGSFTVPGSGENPSWAHPVVLDGKLYLREGDAIHCYEVKS